MSKFSKLFGVVVVLAMLVGVFPMAATPAAAAAGTLKWDTPSMPNSFSTVQANSDFYFYAVAPNGATTWASGQIGGVGKVRYAVTTATGTWRDATPQINAAGAVAPFGKIAIAPDDGNVIALVASTAGFRRSVYVSTDAGITWSNTGIVVPAATESITDIQWSPSYSVGGGQGRDLAVTTFNTPAGVAVGTLAVGAAVATLQAGATGSTIGAVDAAGNGTVTLAAAPTNIFVGSGITLASEATPFTVTAIAGAVLTVTPNKTAATVVGNAVNFRGIGTTATQIAVTAVAEFNPGLVFDIAGGAERLTVTAVDAVNNVLTVTRSGVAAAYAAGAPINFQGVTSTATVIRTAAAPVGVVANDIVTVGTENMTVTVVGATTLTVTRGYMSTAAAQAAGAAITNVTASQSAVWMYQMKTTGFATGWINVSPNLTDKFLAVEFPAGYGGDFSFLVLSQTAANVVLNMGLRNPNATAAPYVNWNAAAFTGYPMVVAATVAALTGDIAVPADFAGQVSRQQRAWVCFDDNGVVGDVYRIDGSRPSVRLNAGARPYMLAYSGSFTTGKLLVSFVEGATASGTVNVQRSLNAQNNSPTWDPPYKAPTGAFGIGAGESRTFVLWSPDGKAAWAVSATNPIAITNPVLYRTGANWAGAANDETGVSYTTDDGDSWNGRAWMDTAITRFTSIEVSSDNTVMYVASVDTTAGRLDSIWRSSASAPASLGGTWERVALVNGNATNVVALKLAKDKADGSVVFWGNLGANNIQRSIDKGQTWNSTGSVTTGVLADFTAPDSNTIYSLGANSGKVAKGTATGFSWSWGAEVATLMTSGYMIEAVGQNVIATSTYAAVSLDGGATWVRNTATAPAGAVGSAIVAMDADFANNKYYYVTWIGTAAAPALGADGPQVARTKAPAAAYEALEGVGGFPQAADVVYAGIATSGKAGNFYALRTPSNIAAGAGLAANAQGARRTIEGTNLLPKPGITADQLNQNLATTADFLWGVGSGAPVVAPNNLNVTGSGASVCLWTVNTAAAQNRPVAFIDTMVEAKVKTTPEGKATVDVAFTGFNVAYPVKWGVVGASAGYDSQLALTSDFADVIVNNVNVTPVNVSDPTQVIGTGVMMAGNTYYFRVRVASVETGQGIHSPWSDIVTLTVKAGAPVQQTTTGVQASAPALGAMGVNTTGVGFAWSGIQGATEYKFVLASDATMTKTLVSTTVKGTAYMYDGKLTESTSYFWQVTPVGGDPSAVFSFTTKAAAVATSTATPAPIVIPAPVVNIPPQSTETPVWVWAVIGIGAVLVIVTLVLIFRTRRV